RRRHRPADAENVQSRRADRDRRSEHRRGAAHRHADPAVAIRRPAAAAPGGGAAKRRKSAGFGNRTARPRRFIYHPGAMTRGPPANLPQGNAGRFPLALACVLAAAGLLPPAALLPCPGGLALLLLPQSGVVLAFGVVAAPLAAALAAALRPAAAGAELRRTAVRIAAAAGFLVALSALAWVRPRDPALAPCLVTAALGLGGAWLLLLHLLAAPAAVGLRRRIALVGEVGVLSAMLHAGGGLTAVAASLYPCIAVANALATATALGAAGFALAVAATPFWREEPAVAALAFAVVVLVPAAFGLGWR